MARGTSLHPRTAPIRASGAADTPQGVGASAPTVSVPQTSRRLLGLAPPHFLCHSEARRFLSGRGISLRENVGPSFYLPASASSTCPAWPSGLTDSQILRIFPSAPIRKVLRTIPRNDFPRKLFMRRAP